jgi:hypothetical protein
LCKKEVKMPNQEIGELGEIPSYTDEELLSGDLGDTEFEDFYEEDD